MIRWTIGDCGKGREIPSISVGENLNCVADFGGVLNGDSFSGTPTVVEIGTSDLTISSISRTSDSIAFSISDQQARPYRLLIGCNTIGSQAISGKVRLAVCPVS